MDITSAIVLYVVIWFMTFFVLLPIRIQTQGDLGRIVPGTQAGPAVIRTSNVSRTLQLLPTGGEPPYLAVALTPTDPLLDAMGFSRGRFALEQAGSAPLAIPAWPEIERVTEDCRG